MTYTITNIGARIRAARESRKFSRKDVAEEAGITVGNLSNIENGHRSPGLEVLVGLCNAIGVSPDEFLRTER